MLCSVHGVLKLNEALQACMAALQGIVYYIIILLFTINLLFLFQLQEWHRKAV